MYIYLLFRWKIQRFCRARVLSRQSIAPSKPLLKPLLCLVFAKTLRLHCAHWLHYHTCKRTTCTLHTLYPSYRSTHSRAHVRHGRISPSSSWQVSVMEPVNRTLSSHLVSSRLISSHLASPRVEHNCRGRRDQPLLNLDYARPNEFPPINWAANFDSLVRLYRRVDHYVLPLFLRLSTHLE